MNNANRKVILLNASNMESFPVYPYAFVQVPAIANLFGVKVVCKDLLGIPAQKWGVVIDQMISLHNPSMILITLKNTDSLTSADYEKSEKNSPYFPIERTRELITAIRTVSNLKIVLGGFGFSILPEELMIYLKPDFGVFGGPDEFFQKFGDVLAGKVEKVANLIYFRDGKLISNLPTLFPPFNGI